MFLRKSCLFLVLVCGLFGYGAGTRESRAKPIPNACLKFECRNTHAYWEQPSQVAWAYIDKQNSGVSVRGFENVFTPDSDAKGPLANANNVDLKVLYYPSCSPHCGKDQTDNKWQSPQTVSPSGNPQQLARVPEERQRLCPTAGGIGPVAASQANNNPNNQAPPGN